ncbi:DUF2478 domain-containing protein [Piscinibacter defluvii]|uniref:DUF2478 domain-containing protein n=1 Tax=Piscinibacter defluvii TaxID=1796922 RepID=UPI0013E2A3F4|nr:DUF2478 domain-containing protein [Piscinibacter defluvii]
MSRPERVANEPPLRAAAVLDDGSADVDALLADCAARQRRAGRRVRGLVMTWPDGDREACGAMVLVDLDTREEYLVSQALGRASAACRADPQGFARASEVLRRAGGEAPDLVVCNRFGGMEAHGEGFSAELLDLMSADIPLLTVVSPRWAPAWTEFTGGAPLLPARPEAIEGWIEATLGSPAPA